MTFPSNILHRKSQRRGSGFWRFCHDRVERLRGEFSDGEDEREEGGQRNETAQVGRAVIWGLVAS